MRPFLASILSISLFASPTQTERRVMRTLPIGESGGWDYVALDSSAKRLYVPRSDRGLVLDLDGRPIGEVPGTAGVHGVALAPGLDRGFTSSGRSHTITIFKLSTLEVLGQVQATGEGPDARIAQAPPHRGGQQLSDPGDGTLTSHPRSDGWPADTVS